MVSFTLNLPLSIIVIFLLMTLVIGLFCSRRATTFRSYAVGDKQFSTATLVMTLLATFFGAGHIRWLVVGGCARELHITLSHIVACFVFFGFISRLALRMGPFMDHLSMAETIGSIYGKYPRFITALSHICTSVAVVSIQLIAIVCILSSIGLDSFHPRILTIFATLILILYSIAGGIRAITFTDVFQLLTFCIIIPLLAWFMFVKTNAPISETIPLLQFYKKNQFINLVDFDAKQIVLFVTILFRIDAVTIQRVYMCSSLVQAKNVFSYAAFLSFVISFFLVLLGLFVFVAVPSLPKTDVLSYIMAHIPPILQGFASISTLAIAMSTADSYLHSGAVVLSHDMFKSVRGLKAASYPQQLFLTRLSILVVGLFAMLIALYYGCMSKLFRLSLYVSLPVVTAPFLLAVFGFRGSSRTALVGMTTGVLTMLACRKWIEPVLVINGSVIGMLANGLAMMVAHYLLPQPSVKGWVGPDDEFIQIAQSAARKRTRRKESFIAIRMRLRGRLAKLKPSNTGLTWIGFYAIFTSILFFFTGHGSREDIFWYILQLIFGSSFLGYAFMPKDSIPDWKISRYWLLSIFFCLPANIVWHWRNWSDLELLLTITLSHLAVILLVLPLNLGIGLGVGAILLSFIYCTGSFEVLELLERGTLGTVLSLLGVGLLTFILIIADKRTIESYSKQNAYLRKEQSIRKNEQFSSMIYGLSIPSPAYDLAREGDILEEATDRIAETISLLDEGPLYKQDFDCIIHQFSQWVMYLKQRSQCKDHIVLFPSSIRLDSLISKVEVELSSALGVVPRLLLKKNGIIPPQIVCGVPHILHLLVTSILRIIDLNYLRTRFIRLELYGTQLRYEGSGFFQSSNGSSTSSFPAIGILISRSTTPQETLPTIQESYQPSSGTQGRNDIGKRVSTSVDLSKKIVTGIMDAHYGYVSFAESGTGSILAVLPCNVMEVQDSMFSHLCKSRLGSKFLLSHQEEEDSIKVLLSFHSYICKVSKVDTDVISAILLLLRRCYGFKRHSSGQLLYVRCVGIAQLVSDWLFHSPKSIYASLLYDLIRYTGLPLSYIKANYNLGVYYLVEDVLNISSHKELLSGSGCMVDLFPGSIRKEDVFVLYIKLSERLYDLRSAGGYTDQSEVCSMVEETLTVDIVLARQYLNVHMAAALQTAARGAQELLKREGW